MFKHYFKTAFRNLLRHKTNSFINIAGLVIGFAAFLVIFIVIQYEQSFDNFNKDYKNIYNLSAYYNQNREDKVWTGVPGPLAVYAKSIPGVKSIVRIGEEYDQNISNNEKTKIFDRNQIAYVDDGFLSMFNYKLAAGNKVNAFPNINSVVITEATANKFFRNKPGTYQNQV